MGGPANTQGAHGARGLAANGHFSGRAKHQKCGVASGKEGSCRTTEIGEEQNIRGKKSHEHKQNAALD